MAFGTGPASPGGSYRRIVPDGRGEAQAVELSPDAMARFERLRALRTQLAREKGLPSYCICHDSTLKLIADQAPGDVEALEQVKGMGPHKIKMYGRAFLQALREGGG